MNTTRKSPGQIAYEAACASRTDANHQLKPWELEHEIVRNSWEAAASAVLADQWRRLRTLNLWEDETK